MGNHNIDCDYCGQDTRGLGGVRGCDTLQQAEGCYNYKAVMEADALRRAASPPRPRSATVPSPLPSPPERPAVPEGYKLVPIDPPKAMWGGLPRQIVMWARFPNPTGKSLYAHLGHLGIKPPQWLLDEVDPTDHVPPKGTVAVVIYRAMLDQVP